MVIECSIICANTRKCVKKGKMTSDFRIICMSLNFCLMKKEIAKFKFAEEIDVALSNECLDFVLEQLSNLILNVT